MNAPLVFVDTETTDIGPRRLAWELAMIRREPNGDRKELQAFIEIDLSDANPFALQVGGFHGRHPLGKWLARGAASHPQNTLSDIPEADGFHGGVESVTGGYLTQQQAAFLWCRWTHGAHVVGAVPNFDTEVMGAAARGEGLVASHHYHLVDIENIIVGYLMGRLSHDTSLGVSERDRLRQMAMPPWKSDDLLAEVAVLVPEAERHTALGDARAVERAWDSLLGGAA